MIFEPTIFDGTVAVIDTINIGVSHFEVSLGLAAPTTGIGFGVISPSIGDHATISLSLGAFTFSIITPNVTSAYSTLPEESTGVTVSRSRSPNPYSKTEMRRAVSKAKVAAGSQSLNVAVINTKLSNIDSDLVVVDQRLELLEAAISSGYSAEVDASVVVGNPVYLKSNTHVDLARANSASTTELAGLATTSAASGHAAFYNSDGFVSKEDWTAITGTALLTPGADYYLSTDTAGMLTAVAPTAVGFCVVHVGRAATTKILDIEIEKSILL